MVTALIGVICVLGGVAVMGWFLYKFAEVVKK